MTSILILLILAGIACVVLIGVVGIVLVARHRSTTGDPPAVPSPPVEIKDGSTYTISRDGVYIKQDFDTSRGKGEMCDATTTTSTSDAAPFKFTKYGANHWIMATDCDGDGNWTSFLNGSNDLIRARDKDVPHRQQWHVTCYPDGCEFKNRKSGTYLGGTFTAPEFGSTATRYVVTPV
jgi:hypothetical protein